jgi:uncharacterized damage-inducible protein DinB/quercetin dioxygenase-like cupin family protein
MDSGLTRGATVGYVRRMAAYNRWMNEKAYAAAARLAPEELSRDRGAFFRSILGTLNHLCVADTIWLKRFAGLDSQPVALSAVADLPQPRGLDEILFDELAGLQQRRRWLDEAILGWAHDMTEEKLATTLKYASLRGAPFEKPLDELVLHFFNHQTHHRGQATTLLMQAGQDVGVTDLLAMTFEDPADDGAPIDPPRAPVLLAPGAGRHYPMGRISATFKADGPETADRYSISEWWLEPKTTGPGPHSHDEDDVFYTLAGTMSILLGTEWIEAPKGAFVLVPRGTVHDFENRGTERAGILNVSAPGGFEPAMPGISEWFLEHPPGSTDR